MTLQTALLSLDERSGLADRRPDMSLSATLGVQRYPVVAVLHETEARNGCQPSAPVVWWGVPTGFDSGDPRCRR